MVGVSELLGEKEIIFPEITALTVGAIAAPKHSWKVSRARMIILIAVCSVIGILIVRFSPFPKAVGLTAAFALCQVIYLMSGTSFAPLISACSYGYRNNNLSDIGSDYDGSDLPGTVHS